MLFKVEKDNGSYQQDNVNTKGKQNVCMCCITNYETIRCSKNFNLKQDKTGFGNFK